MGNSNHIVMTIRVSPSQDQVAVSMLLGDVVLASAIVEAPELDLMIGNLARARACLSDTVPLTIEPGSRLHPVHNPSWRAEATQDGVVLALRHPGMGWVAGRLPNGEASALGRALNAFASEDTAGV